MSQLLDALRKTHNASATPGQSAPFELAPFATPANAASHQTKPDQNTTPLATSEDTHPRRPPPRAPSLALAALAGAAAAGVWLLLMSSPLVSQPALAMPPAPSSPADALQPLPPLPPSTLPVDPPNLEPATRAPRPNARPPHPRPETPAQAAPDPGTRLHRTGSSAKPAIRALDAAYNAYLAGDLPRAETLYRQALTANPHNADALDGLGAIALADGRLREAETHFRHALTSRPQDPVALAGLSRARPTPAQTSQLRQILQDQPDAAPRLVTQLALAERLAQEGRWAEAQQAYFDAHRLAPTDANITYNLAVSLDHLGQRRAAASYYQQTLRLAEHTGHTRFSREQCAARLATLSATP